MFHRIITHMPAVKIFINPDGDYDELERLAPQRDWDGQTHDPTNQVNVAIDRLRKNARHLDDIQTFLFEQWGGIWERARLTLPLNLKYKVRKPHLVSAELINHKFGEIKNDHSAPIGRITNWGGYNHREPKFYRGYQADLRLTLRGDPGCSLMHLLRGFAVNVMSNTHGTLVGNQHTLNGRVALFLDDWLGLDQQATIDRLSGDNQLITDYYDSLKIN